MSNGGFVHVDGFVSVGVDFDLGFWRILFEFEEVPGFAVGFEAHLFGGAVGIEAEHGGGSADFDGDDVPDVEGDDVGGDEVDVEAGVDGASFADGVGGAGFVGLGADALGAFDLNAVEGASVVEDEVVAAGVAPWLGDSEVAAGGLGEEAGFGTFSGDLCIFTGLLFADAAGSGHATTFIRCCGRFGGWGKLRGCGRGSFEMGIGELLAMGKSRFLLSRFARASE